MRFNLCEVYEELNCFNAKLVQTQTKHQLYFLLNLNLSKLFLTVLI